MKRLAFAAFLVVVTSAALPAQQPSLFALSSDRPPAPPVPVAANLNLVPPLVPPAATSVSFPSAALPNAPAPPRPGSLDDYGYRWDLAVGYEFIHFKSAPFSANLSGLHTDLTYNLNDWFGLEGNVVSAWGGDVLGGERSKYVLYAGGGRVAWHPMRRRWGPWAHVLVGGAHVNPQTAAGGKNGFALQVGGGGDYSLNTRLSIRAEGDYVRTQLYSDSQNNYQFGAGVVIHF